MPECHLRRKEPPNFANDDDHIFNNYSIGIYLKAMSTGRSNLTVKEDCLKLCPDFPVCVD